MTETIARLTLEEFILEMGSRPASELTYDEMQRLVHRLDLSDDLVDSHTRFVDEAYARNLVCRTQSFELIVMCWRPGHESTIHDHAGSLSAITVHRGTLASRLFVPARGVPTGGGPVALDQSETLRRGDGWTGVDRTGIHQLANTTNEDLVTVHCYSPPLKALNVYRVDSPDVEVLPLRYTVADDLAA